MFLRMFKHLLPKARAWRITTNKQLRQFFEGLSGTGAGVKVFLDDVWLDIFPRTTRDLDAWDQQWGLPNTLVTERARRDRLDAAWKAKGGQDPRYIQDTLQAAGFDVYVHEWWVPGTEPPAGVVFPPATARNPFTYLKDGLSPVSYFSADGARDMQDGDLARGMDGATNAPSGYPLVNKYYLPEQGLFGDGAPDMQDGGEVAQDGGIVVNWAMRQYIIPADITKHRYFLYIGGAGFPDQANVSASRKNEFETLCLKICPAQQWLGILVNYS